MIVEFWTSQMMSEIDMMKVTIDKKQITNTFATDICHNCFDKWLGICHLLSSEMPDRPFIILKSRLN